MAADVGVKGVRLRRVLLTIFFSGPRVFFYKLVFIRNSIITPSTKGTLNEKFSQFSDYSAFTKISPKKKKQNSEGKLTKLSKKPDKSTGMDGSSRRNRESDMSAHAQSHAVVIWRQRFRSRTSTTHSPGQME